MMYSGCMNSYLGFLHTLLMMRCFCSGCLQHPHVGEKWVDCDSDNTLYGQVLLLSLALFSLVDAPKGRQQIKSAESGLACHVYSAVTIFIHLGQCLRPISEGIMFLKTRSVVIINDGHNGGWCILCKLPVFNSSWFS